MERLDKVISNLTCISRSDARRLIKIGKVFVDGERVKAFDTKVDETREIVVNGEKVEFAKEIYILMNKSTGVVCDDKSSAPYAVDVLPDALKRKDLFCVGRLDKDTTGLLLITNDGEFSHKVISPKSNVEKCYRATLSEPMSDEGISQIAKGLTLKDGTELMPAKVEVVGEDRTTVDFFVMEGKYHQIKRMAGAVGNKVETLHRKRIGNLNLPDDLEIGQAVKIDKKTAFLALDKN